MTRDLFELEWGYRPSNVPGDKVSPEFSRDLDALLATTAREARREALREAAARAEAQPLFVSEPDKRQNWMRHEIADGIRALASEGGETK